MSARPLAPHNTGSHPKQVGPPWYTSLIYPWNMVSWTREVWVHLWEVWWIGMYSLCQSQWYTSKSLSLVCAYFLISQSFFSYGECFMGNAVRLPWNDNQTRNKSYWNRPNHDTVASDISKAGEMIFQPQLNMLNWKFIQTVSKQFVCVWLLGDQFLLCFPLHPIHWASCPRQILKSRPRCCCNTMRAHLIALHQSPSRKLVHHEPGSIHVTQTNEGFGKKRKLRLCFHDARNFSWLHQNVWTQDLFVSNLTQRFRSGRSPL